MEKNSQQPGLVLGHSNYLNQFEELENRKALPVMVIKQLGIIRQPTVLNLLL